MKKAGRNDPCPCGSGKKYKKCCEMKQRQKKIEAKALSVSDLGQQMSQKMGSLFQKNVTEHPIEERSKEPTKDLLKDKDISM